MTSQQITKLKADKKYFFNQSMLIWKGEKIHRTSVIKKYEFSLDHEEAKKKK